MAKYKTLKRCAGAMNFDEGDVVELSANSAQGYVEAGAFEPLCDAGKKAAAAAAKKKADQASEK